MQMPGRNANVGDYRYGFNGQEKENEVSGDANSYTAAFWQYNPRLARRWNDAPVFREEISGYAAFGNNPISNIDPHGDTWFDVVAGIAVGIVTNIIPGSTALRKSYSPTHASDYNRTLMASDAAAVGAGAAMIHAGGGMIGGGLATAGAGLAASATGVGAAGGAPATAVGGATALAGAATVAGGLDLMVNGAVVVIALLQDQKPLERMRSNRERNMLKFLEIQKVERRFLWTN